ncbi:MAG: Replicative DNA helicase [Parcubacteria group bacterium GW2011_GWA1_47_11]|uniref:Replicative DNA helicase n=1 Tax=Candidatus Colwellbacteria bacterium GWA2_46_10 TaxID=1797684 RepID=A0A1G1YVW9_9BACT|nr:MAG: Replicative DNA helicase [Parcubacteria group bacterium GW2011_GWA2_46_10]KKU56149.1 MAG: Replicative DNA helicase [Parcubacteria group bacterium GW2011_GWA1_47_11]OGY56538.1 MAG: replicative DNA helicase [Candidatus Colwellbacteria bacterium GWA2_46_10]
MAKLQPKIPPQDIEAEQSVLGALMIDKDAVASVADLLVPDDFYKKAHGVIFEAVLKLWSKREPIDILSVTSELKNKKQLEEVGGSSYLAELVDSVPTSSHVLHYGKIVKEKRILRDLINISATITQEAFLAEEEIDNFLDQVEKKIFAISQKSVSKNFMPIRDELLTAYERIEKLHEGGGEKYRGIPTGFTDLDNILSGLQRSDLIIVGARPSYGKTSFVLDIARHIAVNLQAPVGVFSLEMSREQVIDRFIAAEAQVDLWKLRTGRLKDDLDFQMIQAALDKLSSAPLFVDDTPSPSIIQMRSMARRLQAEHKGLALIVIDYLQLVQPRTGSDNMVQQVTEISRGLKGLARELAVPVLAVSQLSRGVEQREVKVPRLSDLRESGSIEQDADVVMFVHPKDRGRVDVSPEDENITEIIIAKHRNGPLGTVKLYWDKQKVSFRNLEKLHENAEGN